MLFVANISIWYFKNYHPLNFDLQSKLYNVTRYNRIFNIQHKIAENESVSIKIPSL